MKLSTCECVLADKGDTDFPHMSKNLNRGIKVALFDTMVVLRFETTGVIK